MAGSKGPKAGGLIAALVAVAVITVGGVTGFAFVSWPGKAAPGQGDKQSEVLAKAAAKLSSKVLLDYEDPMERQFALEKVIKDLKADFTEMGDVWVVDDKDVVIYSTKADAIEKAYQLPAGMKIPDAMKFFSKEMSPTQTWAAMPLLSMNQIIGGIRLVLNKPQAAAAKSDGKNIVIIVGTIALLVGIVGPVVLVSMMGKSMGGAAPAGMSTDANVIRALKAEEASINARLESARKEIGRVDDLKSQQNFLESQIEAMRKMQFEETYKLEGLQKEAAAIAGQIDDRKKSLGSSPAEISANLSQQDQELVSKIENHKKEELLLARKIEEIRKKVIDLDRRIEARRKEEADIANRIEVKKREEQALNQRMGG